MEFFKKLFQKGEQPQNVEDPSQPNQKPEEPEQLESSQEEVTVGTKIKVVAALVVVGFAAYVAYWIQEPVEVRTDLLGSGSSMQSSTQAMTQATSSTQQVSIVNFSFDPAVLNVDKGTTVVWTNNDTVPHTVTGDTFGSATLNPGDTYSHTFNDEGSFAYKCTFHSQMKGYVIVGTSSGTTQASSEQVLSGFGAGASLALDQNQPPSGTGTETTQQAAATQEAQTPAPSETTLPLPPEKIYQTSAPAPLHGAAQSLSQSLSGLAQPGGAQAGAQGYTALSAEQLAQQQSIAAQKTAQEQAMAAAQLNNATSMRKGKLASSGPEDVVYAGLFGLILFLNRKKLRKLQKSLR